MEQNKEIDIDIKTIFYMLKRKAIYIVLIAVVGAILSGCITNFFIESKYTAYITLCAYSETNRISATDTITPSQIEASQQLINTYIQILESNSVLEKVATEAGNTLSAGAIRSMVSCAQIDGTFTFRVRVTSTDPTQAMNIANTIADVCPAEIIKTINVGSIQVIDKAELPSNPSSPNLQKNILIGFGAAFLIAFVYFFIKEALDTSIINENDLERAFTVPVLGTIPRLVPVEKTESTSDIFKSIQLHSNDNTKKGE